MRGCTRASTYPRHRKTKGEGARKGVGRRTGGAGSSNKKTAYERRQAWQCNPNNVPNDCPTNKQAPTPQTNKHAHVQSKGETNIFLELTLEASNFVGANGRRAVTACGNHLARARLEGSKQLVELVINSRAPLVKSLDAPRSLLVCKGKAHARITTRVGREPERRAKGR